VLADMNHDGRLDLVASAFAGTEVWINAGDASFASIVVSPAQAGNVVGVGDFNGDGYPDVLQVPTSGGELDVLYGDSTNQLSATSSPTDLPILSPVLGDLNGDGTPDVVAVAGATEGLVRVLFGGCPAH
jgi:hypothetical protein